jgi:hypothetical protein
LKVRPFLPALLASGLLAGCAGYAADYWKPKENLISPQLPRYGLNNTQAECVENVLVKELNTWQLRQLGDMAARLVRARGSNLAPTDLVYVSGLVQDPAVSPVVRRAVSACAPASVAAPATRPAGIPQPVTPIPGPPPPLRWIDLGKADTGQSIAIDISTVTMKGDKREAWFRLTDPDATAPQPVAYRLRVDCKANTITPTGARKYKPDGALEHQEDYSGEWQAPLPVEKGTVMEIALRRVCA